MKIPKIQNLYIMKNYVVINQRIRKIKIQIHQVIGSSSSNVHSNTIVA